MSTLSTLSTQCQQCQQCFKRRCYLHLFLFCILHRSCHNAGIITIGWRLMMQMRLLLIFSHLREAEWAEFALVRLLPAVVHKFSNFHHHFQTLKKHYHHHFILIVKFQCIQINSSLCTMHSLQLFGHTLGLNLWLWCWEKKWLWCSRPPTLPVCYATQLKSLVEF